MKRIGSIEVGINSAGKYVAKWTPHGYKHGATDQRIRGELVDAVDAVVEVGLERMRVGARTRGMSVARYVSEVLNGETVSSRRAPDVVQYTMSPEIAALIEESDFNFDDVIRDWLKKQEEIDRNWGSPK